MANLCSCSAYIKNMFYDNIWDSVAEFVKDSPEQLNFGFYRVK